MSQLVQFSVYLLLIIFIFPHRAYAYPLAALFLMSLLVYGLDCCKRRSFFSPVLLQHIHFHWLMRLFIGYFLLCVCWFLFHDESLNYLDKPFKLFAFVLIGYLLLRYPLNVKRVLFSINSAAIAIGLLAIYQRYYLGHESAFLHMMRIQAGDIAMSMGLFSLLTYFYYKKQGFSDFWVSWALLASLMGISASFFSWARGGWVALPLLAIYYLIKNKPPWRCVLGVKPLALSVLLTVVVIQSGVINRMQTAGKDIVSYQSGNKETSLGTRFELWKFAISAFKDKPLLGWGERQMKTAQANYVREQPTTLPVITRLSHAHNQYFDELAKRGLVGLVAFLVLLGLPFFLFFQQRNARYADVRLLSQLGMMHLFLLAVYCLSQGFFVHNSGLLFYALMTTIFYTTLVTQAERTDATEK